MSEVQEQRNLFEKRVKQRDERDNLQAKEKKNALRNERFCRMITTVGAAQAQAAVAAGWLMWMLYVRAVKEKREYERLEQELLLAKSNVVEEYKSDAAQHGERVQNDLAVLSKKLYLSNQRNNELRTANSEVEKTLQRRDAEIAGLLRQVESYQSQIAQHRSNDRAGEAVVDALKTELEHSRDAITKYETVTKNTRDMLLASASHEVLSPLSTSRGRKSASPHSKHSPVSPGTPSYHTPVSMNTPMSTKSDFSDDKTSPILMDQQSRTLHSVTSARSKPRGNSGKKAVAFKAADHSELFVGL